MKKTVTEWLGELKLTEKKIQKEYKELQKKDLFKVFFVKDKENYEETWKKEIEENKALFQSLMQLLKNRDKIRAAILAFNASNTIMIGDQEYIIALALEKIKKTKLVDVQKMLQNQLHNMLVAEKELLEEEEEKRDEIRNSLGYKQNSSAKKDNEAVEEIMKKYVVEKNDYLELEKEVSRMEEAEIEFAETVNIRLNLKNASSSIEIDL
ncbi:hypothetical protein [Fusobacterium necrophorum]|jgi:hypothetical protein|uniref:hypothetical protein n=1 Tax=Fusobacterium necrophorum TaxID=859 RepID=UPI002420303B|nr:hypothetical protein [Fusobacterium necrophorum]MDK4525110.1 hypothetical protein [Fusobacterium necrophorum]